MNDPMAGLNVSIRDLPAVHVACALPGQIWISSSPPKITIAWRGRIRIASKKSEATWVCVFMSSRFGKKTWVGGQDNELFSRFWQECQSNGLLAALGQLCAGHSGPQTGGLTLGISRVEQDPAKREFYYMIAIEKPPSCPPGLVEGMETYLMPVTQWAVFESRGKVPDSVVQAEMFAFMEWLPHSAYEHALAPEMEVYPNPGGEYCEFWLPVRSKGDIYE